MRFEEVVDFPGEREAYMVVRSKIGLSEEEYLKLSYIERKEMAQAYRVAKKLGLEQLDTLRNGYSSTTMFDKNGNYDLAEATMLIKSKLGVLSLARTKFGLKDSMEEFILKGDSKTSLIGKKVAEAFAGEVDSVVPHLQYLVKQIVVADTEAEPTNNRVIINRFNFE